MLIALKFPCHKVLHGSSSHHNTHTQQHSLISSKAHNQATNSISRSHNVQPCPSRSLVRVIREFRNASTSLASIRGPLTHVIYTLPTCNTSRFIGPSRKHKRFDVYCSSVRSLARVYRLFGGLRACLRDRFRPCVFSRAESIPLVSRVRIHTRPALEHIEQAVGTGGPYVSSITDVRPMTRKRVGSAGVGREKGIFSDQKYWFRPYVLAWILGCSGGFIENIVLAGILHNT